MTARAARRVLWATSLVALPVPLLVVGPGHVPVLRLAMLGGLSFAVLVVESGRGAVGLLAGFLLGQAVVYGALLWIAAAVIGHVLGRWRALATWLAVGGLVALGVARPIYRCPYHPTAARTTLLDVYR